jgi:putative FmdB family regulatory protein
VSAGVESRQVEDRLEVAMPIYEFSCLDCKRNFSEVKPVLEYDPTKVRCPKCNSENVEPHESRVYVETATRS